MRKTLKTRLGLIGAGTGVAALAMTGLALPAHADDTSVEQDWSSTDTMTDVTSSLDAFQAWVSDTISAGDTGVSPVTGVSPDTSVGDVTLVEGPLLGDIASGNQAPVASGNDVTAPVASGNDTSVTAPIEAPVGSGIDVSVPVEAPVGSGNESSNSTDLSVGDIGANVDRLVDDVTSDLGLGDILG